SVQEESVDRQHAGVEQRAHQEAHDHDDGPDGEARGRGALQTHPDLHGRPARQRGAAGGGSGGGGEGLELPGPEGRALHPAVPTDHRELPLRQSPERLGAHGHLSGLLPPDASLPQLPGGLHLQTHGPAQRHQG
ncbi:hypothetical protein M9458_041020, partial [Cirrhinus mrigala]